MPKDASTTSKKRLKLEFYGYYYDSMKESQYLSYKESNRWGSNRNTFLLNDYEKLMTLLFTEEPEELVDFSNRSQNSGNISLPITVR